ncbi:hypothetical protein D3C84_1222470 [compost metagenome]
MKFVRQRLVSNDLRYLDIVEVRIASVRVQSDSPFGKIRIGRRQIQGPVDV